MQGTALQATAQPAPEHPDPGAYRAGWGTRTDHSTPETTAPRSEAPGLLRCVCKRAIRVLRRPEQRRDCPAPTPPRTPAQRVARSSQSPPAAPPEGLPRGAPGSAAARRRIRWPAWRWLPRPARSPVRATPSHQDHLYSWYWPTCTSSSTPSASSVRTATEQYSEIR